ncbi:MAG: cadherin-like domain-containing protein, partial [Coriobacteriia bacterium]|nr:cadherin-like domain-containing protein [Coriobacteriia bacterium]
MQGNIFIRNSSGQMEERAVTDGDDIVLNPGEEILITAEADATEIHYESDTRAVIRLEGIGEFSVESDTTLPDKIALAPPMARMAQQPLGIVFEQASPPAGEGLKILPDTPLMHQAGADSTSYADRPSTPPVDFIAPEALRFNFDYLSMQDGWSSGGGGGRREDIDDLAAPIVFDYSADDDGPFIADPFASLPVLIVSTTASGDEDSAIYLDIRAELTDTDGSETLIVIISGLPEGSVLSAGTDNGDGTWTLTEADLPGLTVTPPQDWDQDFNITVTAVATESSTGHTASVTETISVTITPVNDPPVAGAVDLGQIDEDTSLLITTDQLLSNSYDVDAGDVLTVTHVIVNPFYGIVSPNGDGTWTFTPKADYHGDGVALTFTIEDGSGATATNVATFDILPVNDAPVVGNVDLGDTHLETGVTFSRQQLLSNTYDVDGDTLSITDVSVDPALGSITHDAATGLWTFTPAAGVTGDDLTISFTVSDGQISVSGNALVDVIDDPSGNRPPVADDVDLGQINEDTSITVTATQLLRNSHDPDGDPLSIASVTVNAYYGTVTDNGNGTWTFTPAENYHGYNVALTFTVTDGKGGEATAVAAVDVLSVNDLPVAGDVDLGQINEDTSITFTAAQLLSNSYDPDGDPLSVTAVTVNPFYGTVTDNGDGTWTYVPKHNFWGDDVRLSFSVTDKDGTVSATATVDVLSVNDAPVAGGVDLGQCQAGEPRIIHLYELLADSHDPDGDILLIAPDAVSVDARYGTITYNGDDTWTFTPADGFTGDDVQIRFLVSDGALHAGAVALIDVVADPSGNQPPVTSPLYLGTTDEDTALTFSSATLLLTTFDPDGDPLTVTSVTVNLHYGQVTDNGDGTWTFMPSQDFHGDNIPLSFTVSDGRGGVSTNVGLVDVLPVNDPPVAGTVDLGQMLEDHSLTITKAQLLANSFDVDGDVLDISSVTVDPAIGSITDNHDDTWTFTPKANLYGDDLPITFTVTDGNGGTATATATLDVLPVEDPPVAGDVNLATINENTSVTFSTHVLLSNAADFDGDPLEVTGLHVHPDQGTAAITFTVTDASGDTATAQAMVDVLSVNAPPAAHDALYLGQILEDPSEPLTFTTEDLLSVVHDPEGDPLSIASVDVNPYFGTVTDNGDGTWAFTPAKDYNGKVNIDYTFTDDSGGTGSGSVVIDVLPVDDLPVAGTLIASAKYGNYFGTENVTHFGEVRAETPTTFSEAFLESFFYHPDGKPLTVIDVSVDPAHGTFTDNGDGTWTFTSTATAPSSLPVTLTAIDDDDHTVTATVLIEVEWDAANLAPVVGDVYLGAIDEDTSLTITWEDLMANTYDPEGDPLYIGFWVGVNPAYGIVVNNCDRIVGGYHYYNTWTFIPAENFHGDNVPLIFYISDRRFDDGAGTYVGGTAIIDVLPVTDVGNVDLGPILEDHSFTFTEAQLLANCEDEGDTPSIASVSVNPAQGALTHNGDGTWTFTPVENFHGDAKISFTVAYTDEQISAEANLTVIPVNDTPSIASVSVNPAQGALTHNGDGT